jgi:multidrug efflux pump subunit AcrA (membrane-fusion protein)
VFVALTLAAALGLGGAALWKLRRPAPAVTKAAPANDASTLPPGAEVSLSGKIEARSVVAVPAPIEGTVDEFLVETGQEVAEGQLLARILNQAMSDASEAAAEEVTRVEARIANLEATLAQARLEASRARSEAARSQLERDRLERLYQRQKALLSEGATPRQVHDKTERDYQKILGEYEVQDTVAKHAEERVASLQRDYDAARKLLADKESDAADAQTQLDAGEVRSPVEGIVVGRRGQAGDTVSAEVKDLVSIAVDTSQLKVVLTVEPALAKRLKGGEAALVQILELQTPPLPAEVRSVEGDQVTVEFAAPDPQIKPGLQAQVRIRLGV